jgi:hypothetical protein
MRNWVRACACAALLAFAGMTAAAPMGFKDSWMVMGDFGPNWREAFLNYAFTPRDAVGPSAVRMRSDDEATTRDVVEIAYTRLVHRWNLPDAQANVWFIGGVGAVRGNDLSTRTSITPGFQVDFETTRVYFAAVGRLYRAKDVRNDYGSVRAGFSFYEVDYDEVQPWILLEARRMRGLSEKTEITPMLRLVHNRYFVELGVNNSSQARVNFMYVF